MSDPMQELEQRLMQSPSARARFLADTLELLERNGVDVNSQEFQQKLQGSLDLTEGTRFLGGLVASSVVIVAASAGQRGMGLPTALALGGGLGQRATTVVVAIATAGGSGLGQRAQTVVVALATAGQRGMGDAARTVVIALASAGGSGLGQRAQTVVVALATAGQRGLGDAARTVVVVAASAGQRGIGALAGRGGMESLGDEQAITLTIPAAATIGDVANALRQLADLLTNESVALDRELSQAGGAGTGGGGAGGADPTSAA